jgi:Mg2+ and Co2+ transporter CorA
MAPLIPDTWGVPERFRQRLGATVGRQRAMIDGGHLLLVLHELPEPGELERQARLFWRNAAGEWKATEAKGNGFSALKQLLERYREAIQRLDEELDAVASATELYHVLRRATPLARAARSMHRALQEAREGIENKEIVSLRDTAGDLERSSELLLSDAKNALDYLEAKAAEEQTLLAREATEASHRLNLIAALFLPVTAVGAVFGMNLSSGLEASAGWVFWLVSAAAFAMGFLVRARVTSRKPEAPQTER